MSTALSPDGRYLLVLNGGYKPPSISVARNRHRPRDQPRAVSPMAGWGLPSRRRATACTWAADRAPRYSSSPSPMARCSPRRTFTVVRPTSARAPDFIGDVALTPDGRLLYAADLYHDSVGGHQSAIRHADRSRQDRPPPLSHPLPSRWQIVFRHQLDRWLGGPLRHRFRQPADHRAPRPASHRHALGARARASRRKAKPPMSARLFVAASNTNSVYTVGVTEGKELRLMETINTAMTPRQPAGMTPSALAIGPMGSTCMWSARMPMWWRWWMSPRSAATWKDSSPPAGIPPPRACCPPARWWC